MRTHAATHDTLPSRFDDDRYERGPAAAPAAATLKTSAFVRVADGGVWTRVPGAAGLRIVGVSGHLWITQAGDPGDTTVAPGDTFHTRGRGKVVVQALDDATFRFDDHA